MEREAGNFDKVETERGDSIIPHTPKSLFSPKYTQVEVQMSPSGDYRSRIHR